MFALADSSIFTGAKSATKRRSVRSLKFRKGQVSGRGAKSPATHFVCEGVTIEESVFIGHNVTFINDRYPRATKAKCELQSEADWRCQRAFIKRGRLDRFWRDVVRRDYRWRERYCRRGKCGDQRVPANAVVAGHP